MLTTYITDIALDETYSSEEPVSLTEAKRHIYVEHSDDDSYISDLIKDCRAAVEREGNISLIEKTVTATLTIESFLSTRNPSSYLSQDKESNLIELPYGPVKEITSIVRSSPLTILEESDYDITGTLFKSIELNSTGVYTIVYLAGYPNGVPYDLRRAILEEIAFRYENRGNDPSIAGICNGAKTLTKKHKRIAWL